MQFSHQVLFFTQSPSGPRYGGTDPGSQIKRQLRRLQEPVAPEANLVGVGPGGGGYGPASDRDPEAVLQDVIQEKVTSERARDAYQVVVDPQKRQIDVEATARLRGDTRKTS